jgi:phage N-6-adenine-methyltransferase
MTSSKIPVSGSNKEWATPQWLYDALDAEFGFTLDPCATSDNAKCSKYFTAEQDGLKQSWENENVFVNPPYGKPIELWIGKAHEESYYHNAIVVCLLPARTDTKWWHRYATRGEIRFLKGRLKYGNEKSPAPFPSVIVIFRPLCRTMKVENNVK